MTRKPATGTPQTAKLANTLEALLAKTAADDVSRIETQVSTVLLAGDKVYKLKKPLKLPFIDHSTIDKRYFSAHKEVKINRRTAPDIYLGVAPVIEDAKGSVTIGQIGQETAPAGGAISDWLVVMKRFAQDNLLSRMADAGELTGDDMDALALTIADAQAHCPKVDAAGAWPLLKHNIDATFGGLHKTRHLTGEARLAELRRRTAERFSTLRPVIERRAEAGKLRLCHGDMHLANIVMHDGKPLPFDALEFNDDLATLDTAMDVAFPLADLMRRGETALANRLMNGWLEATNDMDALKILPACIGQRAQIRTMTAAGIANETKDRAKRTAAMAEAEDWLRLSEEQMKDHKPRLIVISGLSGSGKTTLARGVAHTIPGGAGAVHLTTDRTRKLLWGVKPTDKLPPEAYKPEFSRKVIAEIERRAEEALNSGYTVVVDGIMNFKARRVLFEDVAKRCNVGFTGLWLDVDPDELRRRVGQRALGPSESDAGVDILENQLKGFNRGSFGTWQRVDGNGTPDEVLARVKAAIAPKPPRADRRTDISCR